MESLFQRYVIAGGIMMLFLVPTSFLAVAYIIEGFLLLRKKVLIPQQIKDILVEKSNNRDFDELLEICKKNNSMFSNIMCDVIKVYKEKGTLLKSEFKEILDKYMIFLYYKFRKLRVIYSVSPLMGLLGTIFGIMNAFRHFDMTSKTASVVDLTAGIQEALVTTVWGLCIAIPSYIFFSYFTSKTFKYEEIEIPNAIEEITSSFNLEETDNKIKDNILNQEKVEEQKIP